MWCGSLPGSFQALSRLQVRRPLIACPPLSSASVEVGKRTMGGIIHRCSVTSSGCRKEMPGGLDVTRDENGVRGNFHGCVAAAWVATSTGGGPCTVHARDGQTPSAEERGLQALQNVQIATGWGSQGSSRIREKIWLCAARLLNRESRCRCCVGRVEACCQEGGSAKAKSQARDMWGLCQI
ncbi:hypothetical protein BT67DRAFT_315155 [Trichocladium antarcticum]|uniref:Uncharacterized protein n=1 Tax=Trichocladium antarcticum TaxID=1450529 RepID=A0AAN6ZDH7_9PEZI|nr:hypothetical protein BT67DRAFT_315155 [Trichocladium antarcticum]